jgi:hypothetical protein
MEKEILLLKKNVENNFVCNIKRGSLYGDCIHESIYKYLLY